MPHCNRESVVSQVESIQRQFAQAPGLPFAELLPAERVDQVLSEQGVAFRDRDYPPPVVVAMFLGQCSDPDPSLKQAVARRIAQRVAEGKPTCSSNTAAYSRARQRLPEEVLAELTRHTGRELMAKAPKEWSWLGHAVKVVDGSTVSMPDTKANKNLPERPQTGVHSIVEDLIARGVISIA